MTTNDPLKAKYYGHCDACGNGTLFYAESEDAIMTIMENHMPEHYYVWPVKTQEHCNENGQDASA